MKTARFIFTLLALLVCAGFPSKVNARQPNELGKYFAKKQYDPKPLPRFADLRDQLASPICDNEPLWVRAYWKAWELAFKNFHEPTQGSGFVSQFIDAAFNQNIFLWDSCFMTMFCNYAYPLVPGISTLDNFYAKQHEDGEISREIVRATGTDFEPWINSEDKPLFTRWGWPSYGEEASAVRNSPVIYKGRPVPTPNPFLTLDALNHPILAWAELEHYRITGDRDRLQEVWEPLVQYYQALHIYLRQGNGLYMTDWASMDNSPRNAYLKGGGTGIDISSEMALFARQLAQIGQILNKNQEVAAYSRDADGLAQLINRRMWDKKKKFYFDLQLDGKRAPIKTVAAYWTFLAKVASPEQAAALVAELKNPNTFGRLNLVPTLAADQPGYDPAGGYWQGSVWIPTDTMVIRGLEEFGYSDLARKIALNHLELVAKVFQKTGTIWENYAPDANQQGQPAKGEFVGWSGLAPIAYLLEYGIGLRPDVLHNELAWQVQPGGRSGCERYRFGGHVVTLVARPEAGKSDQVLITVESDGAFRLRAQFKGTEMTFDVVRGTQEFEISGGSISAGASGNMGQTTYRSVEPAGGDRLIGQANKSPSF
jgi:mannosylglycerate hydrolase MGH1-like protein